MSIEDSGIGEPKRAERARGAAWRGVLAVVCLILVVVAGATIWAKGRAGRTTFPLSEMPMPDGWGFPGICHSTAKAQSANVKRYPQFVSAKPVFGQLFSRDNEAADDPGRGYYFAIDESGGTDTGYDTLYLDANRTLDLTDDKPAKSHPPKGKAYAGDVFFDAVTIPRGCEDGSDLVTAARIQGIGGPVIVYFMWGSVRGGRIRIAERSYTATLTRRGRSSSRYDLPSTFVQLYAPELRIGRGRLMLWHQDGAEIDGDLSTMLPVNGTWCSLSASPAGDAVTVHPYKGDLGIVRVRFADTLKAGYCSYFGTLRRDGGIGVSIPAQESGTGVRPEGGSILLPEGDYVPDWLCVMASQFDINAHGLYVERGQDAPAASDYFLKVRKDKPCVLDIQSSAEILWRGDEPSHVVPGSAVNVHPALLTPTLVIQDLSFSPNRSSGSGPVYPTVKIADSTGRTLTQGEAQGSFRWTVPADFQTRGGKETLTITATWDTRQLFGVVTGTKEIVVESTGG